MTVPEKVYKLVERFERNIEAYRSSTYKEAELRKEFIEPFFKALGWDVDNEAGNAESYKDVVHEPSLEVNGATKAPDYSFRIGGQRKFFIEAKKPSVDIKGDISPAFQLRRYAWSAKLPLSILTDFEEFAVYDCRIKPVKNDKASKARLIYIKYLDYPDRWEEIASVFSRESILKGSFDKYAESTGKKRGTTEVDDAFLEEIEEWRDKLARHIALRNKDLSALDLNHAVQVTIDRLIFLRICEDRGIEPYEQLKSLIDRDGVYAGLIDLFRDADMRYNSGLFHFKPETGRADPDTLTPGLILDDKVLKNIISRLYYPESPYEFSVLPADILGHVYERFLGKVIRLTPGHRAKVEEKPEVRKAGGVYYTPTYIVDYIVEQTVGKLLKGKTPKAASKFRILDPACGSGSFLLGAYQYLLDWHLEYYASHNPEKLARKKQPPVYQKSSGGGAADWRLTTAERKRILLNNIYGVDIDTQAVEVTKLSLLLKVLEDETKENLDNQLRLLHERALPDLADNIKCGNSLIGPDFYDSVLPGMLTEEEKYRINVFDWKKEFEEVFKRKNPGFDAVIGNPPYVFGRDWKMLRFPEGMKEYFIGHFEASPYQLDMFSLFMEKGLDLAKFSGYVSLIVPNIWLSNVYSSKTRRFILSSSNRLRIALPPKVVFPGLTVDTIIFALQKADKPGISFSVAKIDITGIEKRVTKWPTSLFVDGERPISTVSTPVIQKLLEKVCLGSIPLETLAEITRGIHSYRVGGYGKSAFEPGFQTERDVKERPYHSSKKKGNYRPFIYGKDLSRFAPCNAAEFVKYGVWLAEPRKPQFFTGERVYSRKILGKRLVVTVVNDNSVADQQVYISKPKSDRTNAKFIAGVMASRLISFYIQYYYDELRDAFPQIKVSQLKAMPIRILDFSNPSDKARHDRMVKLVEQMLSLHKQLAEAKTEHQKTVLQRQIDATDGQIDRLVYELYELTDEEVKLIEESDA